VSFPPFENPENPPGDRDLDILLRIVSILRKARREKGYTLRDLAGKAGVTYSFLSYAERGRSQPGLLVLLRWCRALDLDVQAVLREAIFQQEIGK
jgi:transcriptional regulator with XRE-family HTH domain